VSARKYSLNDSNIATIVEIVSDLID